MSKDKSGTEHSVSRRRFLAGVLAPAAVAAGAAPIVAALTAGDAQSAAAAKSKKAKAAAPAPPAPPNRPDLSVAKTPEERATLEKQWKQTLEVIDAVQKASVDPGGEFAVGALAMTPRRLRTREG